MYIMPLSKEHKAKISAGLKRYHSTCKKPKKQAKTIDQEISNLLKMSDKIQKKKKKNK